MTDADQAPRCPVPPCGQSPRPLLLAAAQPRTGNPSQRLRLQRHGRPQPADSPPDAVSPTADSSRKVEVNTATGRTSKVGSPPTGSLPLHRPSLQSGSRRLTALGPPTDLNAKSPTRDSSNTIGVYTTTGRTSTTGSSPKGTHPVRPLTEETSFRALFTPLPKLAPALPQHNMSLLSSSASPPARAYGMTQSPTTLTSTQDGSAINYPNEQAANRV
ncbi:hypothetical protein ACLOJK_029034 [Asimina triloba]